VLKGIGECEGVVAFIVEVDIVSDAIGIVANFGAVFMPADALLLGFFLTVNRNLHSVVKKAIWL